MEACGPGEMGPVDVFHEALRIAAAERYDAERAGVLATLRGYGVMTLDVPAQEQAGVNGYLDSERAGAVVRMVT